MLCRTIPRTARTRGDAVDGRKQESIGQHFVQRKYLDGFIDPSLKTALWVYFSNKPPRPHAPVRVARRNHYYCYRKNGVWDFIGDEGITKLEGFAVPVLEKLTSKHFNLTDEERLTFAGYVALSYLRVPAFERRINRIANTLNARLVEFVAQSDAHLGKFAKECEKEDGEMCDVKSLRKALTGGDVYLTQENRGWTLRQMFNSLIGLQELIFSMRWTFLTCADEDEGFLTTDNPVSVYDPTAPHAVAFRSSLNAYFTFPICRTVALVGDHLSTPRITKLTPFDVRGFNSDNMTNADRQLYAPFENRKVQERFEEIVRRRPKEKKVRLEKGRFAEW